MIRWRDRRSARAFAENGQIVYDIRPQLPADTALGTIGETDEQYANRLVASAAYAETFVLYLGDELQEADPTLQVLHVVDLTPPFRVIALYRLSESCAQHCAVCASEFSI